MSMNPLHADLAREIAVAVAQVLREQPAIGSQWLTQAEAANYLRIQPSGLVTHRRLRTGQKYCKPSGLVRYSTNDLDEWLRSGAVEATA